MTLEQIWPLADYITVHTPLIPATRSKFGLTNARVMVKDGKRWSKTWKTYRNLQTHTYF